MLLLSVSFTYFRDPGLDPNAHAHFAQTLSIVHEGRLSIESFVKGTCDWARYEGRLYPAKAPGLSFFSVPAYFAIATAERATGIDPLGRVGANGGVLNVAVNALPAAFAAVLLLRLLLALGIALRPAVAAVLSVSLGTAYFPYATALYSHTPAAALLIGAAYFAFCAGRGEAERALRRAALAGLCAGLATLMEYVAVIGVFALGVYLLARTRGVRVPLAFVAGGLPALAFFAWYHSACFGGPFTPAYAYQNPTFAHPEWNPGLIRPPNTWVLVELLFFPYRGALFFSPVLLLGAVGLPAARRARIGSEVAVGVAFFAAILLVNAGHRTWWGGFSAGPRFIVPALPLLAPLIALGFARLPRLGTLLAAVSGANYLAITSVLLLLDERVRNPLFSVIYPCFVQGAFVRDNLGHAAGLTGIASLIPLVIAAATAGAVLVCKSGALSPAINSR